MAEKELHAAGLDVEMYGMGGAAGGESERGCLPLAVGPVDTARRPYLRIRIIRSMTPAELLRLDAELAASGSAHRESLREAATQKGG